MWELIFHSFTLFRRQKNTPLVCFNGFFKFSTQFSLRFNTTRFTTKAIPTIHILSFILPLAYTVVNMKISMASSLALMLAFVGYQAFLTQARARPFLVAIEKSLQLLCVYITAVVNGCHFLQQKCKNLLIYSYNKIQCSVLAYKVGFHRFHNCNQSEHSYVFSRALDQQKSLRKMSIETS